MGAFVEGLERGEEAIRLAEAIDQPFTLSHAYLGVGLVHLRKGDLQPAITTLAQSLSVCHTGDIQLLVPWVTASLGYAYALAGHLAEALPLLEQAIEQSVAMHLMSHHARWMTYLGEAYLLADRLEDAHQLAGRALSLSRDLKQRGHEAYALRLLGAIATRHTPPEVEHTEALYRQALALADALGMRPLLAHCHCGLATLYATIGRQEQARTELSTAIEMYRAMDMTFWLPQTEVVLAQVGGR
jgi:tetratricopeptide (TPR) repeat protein